MGCFLKFFSILLILHCQFLDITCVKKKVIVIGGGVAGLAAAHSLLSRRAVTANDIVVLEARNRVGGRIQTEPFGTGFLEYGAQWIHGSVNNPIYAISKVLNLLDEETKTTFGKMSYETQDGDDVLDAFVDKMLAIIEILFLSADNDASLLTPSTDKSLKSILDPKFEAILTILKLNPSENQLARALYDARLKDEKVNTGAGDLNQLSALGWHSFSDSDGDNQINLKNGYISLINHFKNLTSDSNILLNEIVYQIQYPNTPASPTNPVKILTINPTTGIQTTHEADYVLTTFPLGYLKANYKSIFSPPLPLSKSNAIDKLGFGVVNKYWLIFASDIQDFDQGIEILWQNDLNYSLKSLATACNLGNFPFYKTISSFEKLPKMKNVLYGFMVGNDALFTETMSDNCLLEVFYEMLSKLYPSIPRPLAIRRTKWQAEPFSKGSYSYIKMGSSISDVKNLAESLNSRVFFAGEATSEKYFSTVHGAYESGLREADKISKLFLL